MNPQNSLSGKIDNAVLPLIGSPDRICIMDVPGHSNVGDSAIFLGELDFISRHFPRSQIFFYDTTSYTPDADRFIDQASILLVHGGGNFGDIWPHHHSLRKRIFSRFRHKKIIQMPQSISFSDQGELDETRKLIGLHPDLHLLVRDTKALAFAREQFDCPASLCPDMAFALRPMTKEAPQADVFCLLRTDKEVAADHAKITNSLRQAGITFVQDDWLHEQISVTKSLDARVGRATRKHPTLLAPARGWALQLRRRYAEERLAVGVRMLSQGRMVVTDRLHAHILSCLLSIPNFIFDSLDGKVSAFHETWTKGQFPCELVSSPDTLAQQTRRFAGR